MKASGSGTLEDPRATLEVTSAYGALSATVEDKVARIEGALPKYGISLSGRVGTVSPYPAEVEAHVRSLEIGRLELRIGTRFAKVDGRDDLQWYLRVYRHIGQY